MFILRVTLFSALSLVSTMPRLNDQQSQQLSEDFLPAFKDAMKGKRKKIIKNAVAALLPADADSAMHMEMRPVSNFTLISGFELTILQKVKEYLYNHAGP